MAGIMPHQQWLKTALMLGAFIALMLVMGAFVGWEETITALSSLSVSTIVSLLGLAALHFIIRAIRWHIVVQADGVPSPLKQNMLHFFGGFALTATPGRLGELVRLHWLKRETGYSFRRLLPITIADRALELAAMTLLIIAFLVVTNVGTAIAYWLVAVALALVFGVCAPKVMAGLVGRIWTLSGHRKPRLFAKIRRMFLHLVPYMQWSVLFSTVSIGIIGWAFEAVAFWLLLDALGASLSLPVAGVIFLLAILSGALSGLPGGLGGTEATIVALLLLQGVPSDLSIIATAIIRLTTLWFAVLIGLVVFPIAQAFSLHSFQPEKV